MPISNLVTRDADACAEDIIIIDRKQQSPVVDSSIRPYSYREKVDHLIRSRIAELSASMPWIAG